MHLNAFAAAGGELTALTRPLAGLRVLLRSGSEKYEYRGGERREGQGESGKMGKREGGERIPGSCMHP